MNLQDLGFDEGFAEDAARLLQPGQSVARVLTVDRGAYLLREEHGEIPAELSGRFRRAAKSNPDLPCVGDWVCVQHASADLAIIHSVLPRRTFLRRKTPGNTVTFQMISANVDVAFVVQSCHYDFNVRRLDRHMVACREGGIEPVIILSKTDMLPPEEVNGLILDLRGAGIVSRILPLSNTTGEGIEVAHDPGSRSGSASASARVPRSWIVNRGVARRGSRAIGSPSSVRIRSIW